MAKKKLTAKFIENVKPTDRRQEYCDTELTGFGLRVSVKGKKSFYVRHRDQGRTTRITLGAYPYLSLADAREQAREVIAKIENGSYHSMPDMTVREAYELFIALYAKVHNKDWKVAAGRLNRFLKEYGDMSLSQLHKRHIIAHLDQLMALGIQTQANRAHASLNRFLGWCVERDYIEHNPCAGIHKPAKENPRDRVLEDDELLMIWNACEGFGYPFGPLLQVLILTGQRRSEVSGMRWSEIDSKNRVWTIPKERVKNAQAHSVPLSKPVLDLLNALPRFLHSNFVFTTTGRTPVSGLGKYKTHLDNITGVQGWRFHDFRRTAASGMARLDIPPYVVEKVLNHKSGTFSGVLGVYQRYGYDKEKREALDLWAEHVKGLKSDEDINIPREKPEDSRRSF